MGPISFLNNGSTTIGSKMKPVFWYPQFCTGWYPQVMSWLDVSFQGSIEYSCGGKGVGGFSIAMLQLRPEIPVISQWNHPIYAIIHKPIGTKRHRNACVQKKTDWQREAAQKRPSIARDVHHLAQPWDPQIQVMRDHDFLWVKTLITCGYPISGNL